MDIRGVSPTELANAIINAVSTMILTKLVINDIPHMIMRTAEYEEKRQSMVGAYGSWAVGRAESFCPLNDAECVEKEAERLFSVHRARMNIATYQRSK